MSRHRLTVVLSQAQGKNPAKRALEESIVAALIMEPGLDVSVIPYLYDLGPDHTGRLFLESVSGDMVVLSWLYPRAAFWVLDRDGIKGHYGENRIAPKDDPDDVRGAAVGHFVVLCGYDPASRRVSAAPPDAIEEVSQHVRGEGDEQEVDAAFLGIRNAPAVRDVILKSYAYRRP